jgi:hypothetical protein
MEIFRRNEFLQIEFLKSFKNVCIEFNIKNIVYLHVNQKKDEKIKKNK